MIDKSKGLAAWFDRHRDITKQRLAEAAGGINQALISKYLNAERWDGRSAWDPTNMIFPRDRNGLRLEEATRKLGKGDVVEASYWSLLRLDNARARNRPGRRRKTSAPKTVAA